MKLKTFKQFVYKTDFDEITEYTEDIFDHLRDEGFEIKMDTYRHQDDSNKYPEGYIEEEISYRIVKQDRSPFLLEADTQEATEIRDAVLRSRDIMSDWKLQMEIRYKNPPDVPNATLRAKDVKLEGDEFVHPLPPMSPEKVDYPILVLRVYFTRQLPVHRNTNLERLRTLRNRI